jgi:hypothetical protein
MIALTEEQRRALERGTPVRLEDPSSRAQYVLLRAEQYDRVRHLLEDQPLDHFAVAPGVRKSKEALRRDLPQLLVDERLRGRYVAYHGDERVGIAPAVDDLIRECVRRGLPDDQYYVRVIEPTQLIEEEEIE